MEPLDSVAADCPAGLTGSVSTMRRDSSARAWCRATTADTCALTTPSSLGPTLAHPLPDPLSQWRTSKRTYLLYAVDAVTLLADVDVAVTEGASEAHA